MAVTLQLTCWRELLRRATFEAADDVALRPTCEVPGRGGGCGAAGRNSGHRCFILISQRLGCDHLLASPLSRRIPCAVPWLNSMCKYVPSLRTASRQGRSIQTAPHACHDLDPAVRRFARRYASCRWLICSQRSLPSPVGKALQSRVRQIWSRHLRLDESACIYIYIGRTACQIGRYGARFRPKK